MHPDWFHHRCYRSRATDKYFIASRTGIEFIDLAAQALGHQPLGPRRLPLRLHAGQRPGLRAAALCGCFLESKLFGFNALAGESPEAARAAGEVPAKEPRWKAARPTANLRSFRTSAQSPKPPSDWPTYRHDAAAERRGQDRRARRA